MGLIGKFLGRFGPEIMRLRNGTESFDPETGADDGDSGGEGFERFEPSAAASSQWNQHDVGFVVDIFLEGNESSVVQLFDGLELLHKFPRGGLTGDMEDVSGLGSDEWPDLLA